MTHTSVARESVESVECDRLIREATSNAPRAIVSFSQPRRTMQTPGIPDRRYRLWGIVFWWEVKAADGELTPAEAQFAMDEARMHSISGVGTAEELARFLRAIAIVAPERRAEVAEALAIQTVAAWLDPVKQRARRRLRG